MRIIHGCFSRFLNHKNDTKSRKASYKIREIQNSNTTARHFVMT